MVIIQQLKTKRQIMWYGYFILCVFGYLVTDRMFEKLAAMFFITFTDALVVLLHTLWSYAAGIVAYACSASHCIDALFEFVYKQACELGKSDMIQFISEALISLISYICNLRNRLGVSLLFDEEPRDSLGFFEKECPASPW